MSLLWRILGRIGYYVGYVPISLYLRIGERTRVVVQCQGKVLVVRSWLSKGDWDLPGGGLHKNEAAAVGAARELKEELGLLINPTTIKLIKKAEYSHGLTRYPAYFMQAELGEIPAKLTLQKHEIIDAKWVSASELSTLPMTSTTLNAVALEALQP